MPQADDFNGFKVSPSEPARSDALIVPSDDADLPKPCRALFVNVGGPVRMQLVDSPAPQTYELNEGIWPLAAKKVFQTGTNSPNLIALY
ncbi:MAG: hypothetical protein JWO31_3646 [Phycisphaerales bacterium]|nr:hypothetical protein [Phycisphaerales bacterium]